MEWNFDITQAPRGRYETTTRKVGRHKKEAQWDVFVPEKFLATDGTIVTITYRTEPNRFHPDGRWAMFASYEDPIAWMPLPTPPKREDEQ